MPDSVEIRKVHSAEDFRSFFEFPWMIYRDDPNWVPHLLSMRRETLDKKHNPAWEYMEGDYFTAWRHGRIVGTIAAFVNHRHNGFHEENIAWFGFFEVEDDPEAAAALLTTAEDWARNRGYDALRGPQSFTTHEEVGLLVEGFERPVMLMPYHHAYYQRLIADAGYEKVMDLHSFRFIYDPASEYVQKTLARLDKIIARLTARRSDVHLRPLNRKNLRTEFALVKQIYNDAWEKNWGFTPMTERELDALIDGLGGFFDADLACVVEVEGEPAAFALGVPDFNIVLRKANPQPGVPEWFTLARALWHWKMRGVIDGARVPLMGVREPYRRQGLDLLMYHYFTELLRKQNKPYHTLDAGWILESNHDMMGTLEGAGLENYRTYRLFEKSL